MRQTRYYSFVEPAGLEGLFRITWEQGEDEDYAVPMKGELWRDEDWIEWPDLFRHFVPFKGDRIVEVPPPAD